MGEIIQKFSIKSPVSKNSLSEPIPFNLMFQCQIGPESKQKAYLRSVNFKEINTISQLGALIAQNEHVFIKIIEKNALNRTIFPKKTYIPAYR